MQTLKQHFLALGLQQKLLLPTIALLAVTGSCFLLALSFYLEANVQRQSDRLGHSLAQQLAEQSRQSLVQNDSVSLQVLINTLMENNPEVDQVVVFNHQHQTEIKSNDAARLNDTSGDLPGSYRREITMAGTKLGAVEVTINGAILRNGLQPIFSLALFSWISFSILLCTGLNFLGGNLGKRLNTMSSALPSSTPVQTQDELSRLEAMLKPLLVRPDHSHEQNKTASALVLTVCAKNLPDLKNQLTHASYRRLIRDFDAAVNATAKLFEASRSAGSRDCLHLTLDSGADALGAVNRAVCCFAALSALLQTRVAGGANGGPSLSAVLKPIKPDPSLSQFEQEQFYQRALSAAEATVTEAAKAQLLVADTLVEAPSDTAVKPGGGSKSGCTFYYDKQASSNLLRFTSLQDEQQIMLEQQLAFIRSQLLPAMTS